MNPGEILQINFQKLPPPPPLPVTGKKRGFIHQGGGDYVDIRTGHHYENPRVNGKYTWRKLSAITHAAALKEIRKKRSDYDAFKLGLSKINPYDRNQARTVADLCQFYLKQNCPRRNVTVTRQGKTLTIEQRRVATLIAWPGSQKSIDEFSLADCARFHAWRVDRIAAAKLAKAGGDPSKITDTRTGDRQVDIELVTLSNIFRCAMRNSLIDRNPIATDRGRFRDPKLVKHCRDQQPASSDELHNIARVLLDSWKSAPLGWQALFEAMIGPRSSEILELRIDARNETQAGCIHWNEKQTGGTLYLLQKEGHKGTYGHIKIHPALASCLKAHAEWHQRHWPQSPWYFPSPDDPRKHIGPSALTHALYRVTKELGLPGRTSHGFRSYFVNVLRSDLRDDGTHRYTDAEIALRIGQKTGGRLIVDVYGEIPAAPLSWLPSTGPAAWEPFDPARPEQLTLSL